MHAVCRDHDGIAQELSVGELVAGTSEAFDRDFDAMARHYEGEMGGMQAASSGEEEDEQTGGPEDRAVAEGEKGLFHGSPRLAENVSHIGCAGWVR